MLLEISFIDRFIRGIYPTERKVVPWHSHPVAILDTTQRAKCNHTTISTVTAPIDKPSTEDDNNTYSLRVARKTLLEPHSKHQVLETTIASGIETVELRVVEKTRQKTSTAYGVIDLFYHPTVLYPCNQPFCESVAPTQTNGGSICHRTTYVRDDCIVHFLLKFLTETPENIDQFAFTDLHPASRKAKNLSAHGALQQEKQSTKDNPYTHVACV